MMMIALGVNTLSYGQSNSSDRDKENIPSILKKRSRIPDAPHYNVNLDDICQKNKNIKTAGIVLSSLGGAMIAGGAIIISSTGKSNVTNDNGNGYRQVNGPLRTVGIASVTIGTLSVASGIPLAAIGAVRAKRLCHKMKSWTDESYLQLNSGENGMGLALKF